ncbi:MAG TPA: hypothetical protein VFU30_10065 [Gaiellaceae bacterium]|nr:hypothetical protein [Gaiellaceae bacterium]
MRRLTALGVRAAVLVGALAGSTLFFGGSAAAAGTFVVTTSADSADVACTPALCSLRDAIISANAAGGGTITFAIPGAVVGPTISLATPLPAITSQVTIDGTTQPGAPTDAPGVTLVSSGAFVGLDLGPGSDGSTVHGLSLGGFNDGPPGVAILVESNNDTITEDWIGVAPDSSPLAASFAGIQITGSGAVIGGGAGDAPNRVVGSSDGIIVGQIGGGIATLGTTIQGNLLEGNASGIYLGGAGNTVIGNNDGPGGLGDVQQNPQLGNVITGAGSFSTGIDIEDGSFSSIVAGNFIGVDRASQPTVPNGDGISIFDAPGHQIGPGNVIGHSTHDGVAVNNDGDAATTATGNRIVANSIFDSGNLGIELVGSGNRNEPAPVITSAAGGTISGTVASNNGDAVFVELFANSSCNPPFSTGAGRRFLLFVASGPGAWSADISGFALKPGQGVTATATDQSTNDTSEFSNCAVVPPAGSLSGSVDQTVVQPVDVTTAGPADWAIWGFNSSGSQSPSALTPNETKVDGGRQISDASIVNGDNTPVRGFGTDSTAPFNFSWGDGSPAAVIEAGLAGITAPKVGQGLSFTVPASRITRTLTIWTSAHFADGTLTAHLSDDSAPDFTRTIHAVQGDFTQSGENVPATFTLQYHAGSAGQHLTVTWMQSANNFCGGCEDIVLYGAALSGGGNATSATASLSSDESVPMAASNVPIADIPLEAFEPRPPGSSGLQLNGLQLNGLQLNGLQLNGLQLNGLQLNGLQLNGLQLNGLQLNGLQLNGLQLNGLQLNGLQLNGLQLNGLQLNGLPLDPVKFPDGWAGILAGTDLANQPLQTISLSDVLDVTSPQTAVDKIHALTLGDFDLSGSALGQVTLGSLALSGTQLNGLPPAYQNAIWDGLGDWCQNNVTNPATACGPGKDLGDFTLLQLALAGAPVQGLQLNGLQLNGLQLNGLQLNGLQLNGLATSASSIGGLQLNGLQLNGLPLGGLQLNGLQLNGLQLNGLFDCTLIDCNPGTTVTLAEAQAAGAILSSTTVGDLDGGYGGFTIADLLESLLAPGSQYRNTATFADLIGLFIPRASVPWETLSPETLSLFDKNRPTMDMSAQFQVNGAGTPDGDLTVKIPDGFDYDPGSTTEYEDDGSPTPFADPSVSADGHTLTWHFDSIDANVSYHVQFKLRSGTTVGPTQATETITSGSQSATDTVPFTVNDSFPGNDQPGEAPEITPDTGVQMSALPTPGAVDWYKIPMPPAGTRVHVHLTDLPADYDLALYSNTTTSVRTNATDQAQPLQDGVEPDRAIDLHGGTNGQLMPTALQDVPNDPGVPLVQVSANRGTDDEELGFVSPGGVEQYLTFAVFGYNGAFSPKPYSLRVTTQSPPPTLDCPARTLPHAGAGTTPDSLPDLTNLPQGLNTVILVNEKRLGDTYGASQAANGNGQLGEAEALTGLRSLAGDSALGVKGVVVPVEAIPGVQSLYDTWDTNPCDNGPANEIANKIADEVEAIKNAAPTVKYVVFAGGDDQIPFFRVPDLTLLDNESGFAAQFGANEYHGALAGGDLLSDNPYLDTRPVPASGRELFIPDLVGGRLVESAGEIANAVTSFEGSGGILQSASGFVSGYDFVADGSQQVADRLSALGVNVSTLANPLSATSTWGIADLFGAAFPSGGPANINDWNGHYDNTRALMANQTDLLSTGDLTASHALNGGIFFTMGCHAGFQTTDAVVGTPVLDWAQYLAGTHTGFVGNTGFGYGSTDSASFSEELMTDFAGQLGGSVTLGEALTQAKDEYYLSRVAFSVYDEKTLSEAELYGLPMYGVGHAPVPLADPPPDPVSGTSQSTSPSVGSLSTFTTGVQSANFSATPSFSPLQHGADGDYYTNAGQVQAPNYRPLQPFVSLPATRSGLVAHGVVIDNLTSQDHSPFDPDNVRPIVDQSATEPEPQFDDEAWPEKIPTLASLGSDQSLNLATGQFFTDTSGSTPTGVERLWTQIDGRVTYSNSTDFTPPTIDSIDAFIGNGVVAFSGRFSDLDQDGNTGTVAFAQVVYDDGTGHWIALPLQHDTGSDTWSAGASFGHPNIQFFVEACDAAGNCGYSSNKGRYYNAQPLQSSTGSGNLTLTPNPANPSSTSWYTGNVTVTATTSAQTVDVSVDGGPFEPTDSASLTTDGAHIVQARDSDGDTATGAFLIDRVKPATPQFTGIQGGTIPVNNLPSSVGCTSHDDLSGLQSCVVTGFSTAFGTHTLTATATDNAGNVQTASLTYIVGLQAGDILPPVLAPSGDQTNPNASDLQVFKLKSTVPLKFHFYLDAAKTALMTTPPAGSTATLYCAKLNSSTSSTDTTEILTGTSDTGNQFRWTGSPDYQYVYNLATKSLTTGKYYCQITLSLGGTILGQSAPQYFILRS